MRFRRAMPVLQVRDVVRSASFYEGLGFQHHGFWGEPPAFAIVQRGEVTLALDRARDDAAGAINQWWVAYVYVDDVDALHREFSAAGVTTRSAPTEQEYGCRDFDLVDPDGHRIAFGQDLSPDDCGPGLAPPSEQRAGAGRGSA